MENLGLRVTGLVMGKNHYPGDVKNNRSENWSLDLAVPRCKELLNVKISKVQFEEAVMEGIFTCTLGLRTYKGVTYYEAGLN